MKLLIDHGSSHNLGDTAMLEGVVGALHSALPDAELHVADRPGLRTAIWDWPNVLKASFDVCGLFDMRSMWHSLPFFWRYWTCVSPLEYLIKLSVMSRFTRPGSTAVIEGGRRITLEDTCRLYDGLLVVGGGNLTDQFRGQLWRRVRLIETFASQSKPVVLTGQQVGPFNRRGSHACLARALAKADFVGLREPTASLTFCREAGLSSDRYAVMGDDSFALPPCLNSAADEALGRLALKPGRFVAVNVRFAGYAPDHAKHVDRIAAILREIWSCVRMPLLIVPIALNPEDSDIHAGRLLQAACSGIPVAVWEESDLTAALVKGILGRAFGAVGVSYHFCTFALSQGIPAVCLHAGSYYSQKGEGLKKFWGDDRLALSLAGLDEKQGARHVVTVFRDEGLRQALAARSSEACRAWRDVFEARVRTAFHKTEPITS